jgi:hypothetical protein
MKNLRRIIKSRVSRAIELLPYGRDVVLHMTRNSRGISYRGCLIRGRKQPQAASKGKSFDLDAING